MGFSGGGCGQYWYVADFLVLTIIASVVLTIVVNVVFWLFPDLGRRVVDGFQRLAERQAGAHDARYDGRYGERHNGYAQPQRSRVHVFFPWKAMLIGSIALTIALNLAIVLIG